MIKIIAHRGNGNHKFKENTKEALVYSLNESYIDGVEFDIRFTKDKKIVIVHDIVIDRVSNGKGFVSNLTLKELKKYNFGSKDLKQKICTLDEFLKSVKCNKKIVIEIKWEYGDYKEFISNINKIVSKYKKLNIYFISFNYEVLSYMKKVYPKYRFGLLIGPVINNNKINNELDFNLYNSLIMDKIKYEKELMIYNIRSKNKLKKIPNTLFDIGVITNNVYGLTH